MARTVIPTNFKDDELAEEMQGRRRYRQILNLDGTVSFEDETDYDTEGSTFGASRVNEMAQNINESADVNKIIDDLEDIAVVTQNGFMAGAKAVKELNSNLGDISDIKTSTLNSVAKLLQYWINRGELSDPSAPPIEDLVPVMTSATTPSGQVFSSATVQGTAYIAFNNNFNKTDLSWSGSGNSYIGYKFNRPVVIRKVKARLRTDTTPVPSTWRIEASNDGNNWTDIGELTKTVQDTTTVVEANTNSTAQYQYCRIRKANTSGYTAVNTLQFYGY